MTTGVTTGRYNLRTGPGTAYPWIVTLGFNTRLENIEIRGDWVRARVPSLNLEGWVSRAGVAIDLDPAKVKPVATGSLAALAPITPLKPAGDELIDVATTKTGDERRVALTWNRYGGYIRTLAEVAEIDPLAAVATFAVESGANAYDSNGKMIIRVEAHLLYDKAGPNGRALWVRHFTMASPPTPRWQGHTVAFPGAPRVAYHGNNTLEWKTLELAGQLFGAEVAARSTSFGLPQVLGSNFARLGYQSASAMLLALQDSTHRQIAAFFDFCRPHLFPAIRARDWKTFAGSYNGPANVPTYSLLLDRAYRAATNLVKFPNPVAV